MSAPEAKSIPVIRIVNPFDPREFVRDSIEWSATKTLADYFPVMSAPHIVSINGKIIAEKDFPLTYLGPDDNLVMCPVPTGGGGGSKSVLRVVAMISVAVFAPQIAYAAFGNMGATCMTEAAFAASGLGMAATAGIMFAGAMLVNSMLPPPQQSNNNNGATTTSSYGIDGPKNTAQEGVVVPVCYGMFRTGGNIVDMYVENIGWVDGIGDTQMLYMLINAGEGPIASLTNIWLNDEPIEKYANVEYQIRTGQPSTDAGQTVIPWFNNTITPISVQQRLGTLWSYYTTQTAVDKLRVDLLFPNGLYGVDTGTGNNYSVGVNVEMQIRPKGGDDTQWVDFGGSHIDHYDTYYHYYSQNGGADTVTTSLQANTYTNGTDVIYQDQTVIIGIDQTMQTTQVGYVEHRPVYVSGIQFNANQQSAVRASAYTDQLTPGYYEIRYRRLNAESMSQYVADELYVDDVNEITLEPVAYVNSGLVAIKIQLTNQLSGVPKVTFLNGGRIIKVWDTSANAWTLKASSNPAWIAWDILTNKRFGGRTAESRLDFEMFLDWAQWCDQNGLTFNGVYDTEMNVWDALQLVMRVGHAQLVMVGTRYTVVIERATDPVMMFTVGNIIEGTFKETWLSTQDRANIIELTYFDKTDDYKQHTVRVFDEVILKSGRKSNTSSITMYGIVDHDRAYKEALMQLNMNRYILQTVDFAAPMDAIACTVGDLILVQHDMPQWGFGGRTEAGSTTSVIQLDRPVSFDDIEGQYKILVIHDALQIASGSVYNVAGNSLFLTGFTSGNVKRIQVDGLDLRVTDVFSQGNGSYGVIVEDATGVTVNSNYTLWDTDVLEERDVVNTGETDVYSVTVQSPLSQAPDQFVNWMFGEVTKVKKPFRVKSISGSQDYRRDIQAIEYNESVYDLSSVAIPTPDYSALTTNVDQVTITDVSEELFASGNTFRTHVAVHFNSAQSTYINSTVYVSVDGKPFYVLDQDAASQATIDLDDGQVVIFKVVAHDVLGVSAPSGSAPTVTHTVLGKMAPPADVQGFVVTKRPADLLLTWKPNQDLDLKGYEIRVGASWDAGTILVTNYAGTSFTDHQSKSGVYYYHIRAIDQSGNYSANVTTFALTLAAPGPVQQFDCIQSGNRLEFRWQPNSEPDIDTYEIREGTAWATSQLVTQIMATNYTMPSGSSGTRQFWIKAIAAPGIYSDVAEFVFSNVAQPSNTNLVISKDETADGYPGVLHDASVVSGAVIMDANAARSEYIFDVGLGSQYLAQNTIFTAVDSVVENAATWGNSTFTWKDASANSPWISSGDMNSVSARFQIALDSGLQIGEVDGWRLDGSTTSVGNVAASVANGVTYGNGRYGQGIHVTDTTQVAWNINVPSAFNEVLWMTPDQITDSIIWSAVGNGIKLSLGYSAQRQMFYLEDHLGKRVNVPFVFNPNNCICIGIVQTSTTRKLFVGTMDKSNVNWAQATLAPLGSFTSIQLY